jgi:hypothetical protein
MAMQPDNASQKRVHQDAWTAALGSWYLQPLFAPSPSMRAALDKAYL